MQAQARAVMDGQDALRASARRLAAVAAGHAMQTRVHGDFHLGQVLVVGDDAFIIDFEGEPARTMEQRRAKSSPMRDVAGLLRSFDYAAAAAMPGRQAASDAAAERRLQILRRFRDDASASFLAAYRAVLDGTDRPWATGAAFDALLDLFLLEKAAYEIRYEAANRPAWVGIPLGGLHSIAQRLVGGQA